MTFCRDPKRKPLRTQPNRPLIAVKVAGGCGCSTGGVQTVVLDVVRDGVKDPDTYRYTVYDYNSDGDPRFFLDFNVVNTPGVYLATVKSLNQYEPDETKRFVECGEFQIIIGPSCSFTDKYVSMPANSPNEAGRTESGNILYDDMQPSYALDPLLL